MWCFVCNVFAEFEVGSRQSTPFSSSVVSVAYICRCAMDILFAIFLNDI